MNDVVFFAQGLWTSVGIIAVLLALRFALVPSLVEEFRQRIFHLRRQLFLVMAHGHVRSQDAAYVRLTTLLNGTLRHAKSVGSFFRMTAHSLVSAPRDVADQESIGAAIAAIDDPQARARLERIRLRLGFEVVRYMIVRSPVFWPFLLVVLPFVKIYQALWRDNWDEFSRRVGDARPVQEIEKDIEQMSPPACLEAA